MSPSDDSIRQSVGRRLKKLRVALGHTQEEMAYALGIRTPRYSKYEIGRSEAPYEVLIKLARLANVTLDYIVAGKEAHAARRFSSGDQMTTILANLPIPAVVYDAQDRIVDYNPLYQETYFPEHKRFLRPGTPHEEVLRTWAYSQGLTLEQTERFVTERLNLEPDPKTPVVVHAGPHAIQIRATWHGDCQLVLVTNHALESKKEG